MPLKINQNKAGYAKIIYIIIFGGAIGVFAKFALPAFSPFFLIFVRVVLSLLFFTAILAYQKKLGETLKIIWIHRWPLSLLALSGVILGMITSFVGLEKSSAVNYSLLFNAAPLAMIFLSAWLLEERVGKADYFLFIVALFGSLLIITQGRFSFSLFSKESFLGDILIFAGALCWGLYSILGPRLNNKHPEVSPLVAVYGAFLIAAVVMTPFVLKMGLSDVASLIAVGEVGFATIASAILLSILSTALLFLLWLDLVSKRGGVVGSFVALIEDVAGAILPIFLLQEVLTIPTIVGGATVLLASFVQTVVSARNNKKKPTS
jgi:drug/metabolite transporter (DMT)-like permease